MKTHATRDAERPAGRWNLPCPVIPETAAHRPDGTELSRPELLQRTIGNLAVQALFNSGAVRAKLAVGSPGDHYEREADRIADQVMRMPVQAAAPAQFDILPSIRCQQPDEEEEKLQAESIGGPAPEIPPGLESAISNLQGGGRPLDAETRAFFEPRFGRDLGDVRTHSDASAAGMAEAVNARAFTFGRDLVFGNGQYDPGSDEGKRLLAHELVHVMQQSGTARMQRKIKAGSVSLDSFLGFRGVVGFQKSGNTYSHPGVSITPLDTQILYDMLSSQRTFTVSGSTQTDAEDGLDDHIAARKGIVDFAAKKQYGFGAGSAMRMNPAYWEHVGSRWRVKTGVDQQTAMNDLNVNPSKYDIACQAATSITMFAGSGLANIVKDNGVADSDWIPGDWGYITNTKFPGSPVGNEGENIIYTGGQQFWGHYTGSNTYRTLDEWRDAVRSWDGGERLESHRQRPDTGLS